MIGKLIDHYEIIERIGLGGMGEVWLAHDSVLDRKVALKVLPPDLRLDPNTRIRFLKGAKSAAALDHPYICKIYQVGEVDEDIYIAMEYLEGQTLEERLLEGPLSLRESLSIATEIAEALEKAHQEEIIHRDIKPSNIMITPQGHVKVMDFGIAKALVPAGETTITTAGMVVGTWKYMSPEQAVGDTVDHRTDIYSFGIVAYQCLSGQLPFEGETNQTYLENLITRPPEPLPSEIPRELSRLVMKCLSKQRGQRHRSGGELLQELLRVVETITGSGEQGIQVRSSLFRAIERRRWFPWSVIAGVFIGLVLWIIIGSTPGIISERDIYPLHIPIRDAGELLDEQITPDNGWITYLKIDNGIRHLWKQPVTGGEPERINLDVSDPSRHFWSPDGALIACMTGSQSDYSVTICNSTNGAEVSSVFLGDSSRYMPDFVRWIQNHLYLRFQDMLWCLDTESGSFTQISRERPDFQTRGLDVRPDEQQVVYGAYFVNQYEDLWVANLDGTDPRRLTHDPYSQSFPRWLGEGSDRIAYCSDEGGQTDIWQRSMVDQSAAPMAISWEKEISFLPSLDGSLILTKLYREKAELWRYYPVEARTEHLTDEALLDYLVSVSEASDVIAFQRSRPEATYATLHSPIVVAEFRGDRLSRPRPITADGFNPVISPDGNWLAYSHITGRNPGSAELWITDLASDDQFRVTERHALISYHTDPFDVVSTKLAWGRNRSELYYVTCDESQTDYLFTIRPVMSSTAPIRLDRHAEGRGKIRDLCVSLDGLHLAYIYESPSRNVTEAWLINLENRTTDLITSESGLDEFFLKAWQADGGGLLAMRSHYDPVSPGNSLELIFLDLDGSQIPIHTIPKGWEGNVTFDPRSELIYYVTSSDQIHNLAVYNIRRGHETTLTHNLKPYTTYAGIRVTADGSIVYSLQEYSTDLGVIRRDR